MLLWPIKARVNPSYSPPNNHQDATWGSGVENLIQRAIRGPCRLLKSLGREVGRAPDPSFPKYNLMLVGWFLLFLFPLFFFLLFYIMGFC